MPISVIDDNKSSLLRAPIRVTTKESCFDFDFMLLDGGRVKTFAEHKEWAQKNGRTIVSSRVLYSAFNSLDNGTHGFSDDSYHTIQQKYKRNVDWFTSILKDGFFVDTLTRINYGTTNDDEINHIDSSISVPRHVLRGKRSRSVSENHFRSMLSIHPYRDEIAKAYLCDNADYANDVVRRLFGEEWGVWTIKDDIRSTPVIRPLKIQLKDGVFHDAFVPGYLQRSRLELVIDYGYEPKGRALGVSLARGR